MTSAAQPRLMQANRASLATRATGAYGLLSLPARRSLATIPKPDLVSGKLE